MARTRPVHPAANLFPMMEESALRELTTDIDTNGLQEPVVYFGGKLLDGRNRLAACARLDIEPDEVELDESTDPVAYVLSANLHRRHLTTSQHSMVAARVESMYAERAKERQKKHGGTAPGKPKDTGGKIATSDNGKARDEAGAAVGVSGRTVSHAKTVIERGSKELQRAVDSGEVAVSKAAAVAKSLPKAKQLEAATSKPAKAKKSHPLSDQYLDLFTKFGTALIQIDQDFGGCEGLLSDSRWDSKETSYFKQHVAILYRSLGKIKKELDNA